MPGITRGEAIWEQTRDTALPDTDTTLVQPPVQAGDARNDGQDARLDAIEARLAGLERAAGLFQVPVGTDAGRLADGGTAEMMDEGWLRADDSDVRANLENCAEMADEGIGLAETLAAEMYGDRRVASECPRVGDGDLLAAALV